MAILEQFEFATVTKGSGAHDPLARSKAKMKAALEQQIRLLNGCDKPAKGQRRARPWWFHDASGQLYTQVRYGSRPMTLSGGANAIRIGSKAELATTYEQLIEALEAGEMDEMILAARAIGHPTRGRRARTVAPVEALKAAAATAAPPHVQPEQGMEPVAAQEDALGAAPEIVPETDMLSDMPAQMPEDTAPAVPAEPVMADPVEAMEELAPDPPEAENDSAAPLADPSGLADPPVEMAVEAPDFLEPPMAETAPPLEDEAHPLNPKVAAALGPEIAAIDAERLIAAGQGETIPPEIAAEIAELTGGPMPYPRAAELPVEAAAAPVPPVPQPESRSIERATPEPFTPVAPAAPDSFPPPEITAGGLPDTPIPPSIVPEPEPPALAAEDPIFQAPPVPPMPDSVIPQAAPAPHTPGPHPTPVSEPVLHPHMPNQHGPNQHGPNEFEPVPMAMPEAAPLTAMPMAAPPPLEPPPPEPLAQNITSLSNMMGIDEMAAPPPDIPAVLAPVPPAQPSARAQSGQTAQPQTLPPLAPLQQPQQAMAPPAAAPQEPRYQAQVSPIPEFLAQPPQG